MIPSDGVSTLFKEAALKRIEQILLAEWREKKDFYQREGQKREKLIEKMDDAEKQVSEEIIKQTHDILEFAAKKIGKEEKEMAIYATGFMDGIYTARKVMDQE